MKNVTQKQIQENFENRVQALLYLLLRDGIPYTKISEKMLGIASNTDFKFSSKTLAATARHFTDMLGMKGFEKMGTGEEDL
jgi:hypothetical protein